jgi:SNF2 family DNA or RNA helicase
MIWNDTYNFLDTIKDEKRYGIFLDMGVGKTSLLLALFDHKFFNGVKKVLIITPKKVSLSTWQNEIKKWDNFKYMLNNVSLISGTEEQRNQTLQNVKEYQIHIISSSLTEWLVGKKVKKGKRILTQTNPYTPQYDLIVVDECSQFKDTSTRRYKALKSLSLNSELFLLSGTPFSNLEQDKYGYKKADELYYVMYLLGIYKENITQFRNDFCFTFQWDLYTQRMKPEIYQTLTEQIYKKSIRKVLDIQAEIIHTKIYCETDQTHLNTLKKDFYLETDGYQKITASNQAIMINKALQVSNGFIYDENGYMTRLNTFKFNALQDLLKTIDDNVIIFYNFKEDKNYLLTHLQGAVAYEGDATLNEWNAKRIKYLILSPFSEKYGLNLQQGGHTIIWYGLVWSAESYEQSNARLHRRGQEHDVHVYYLLGKKSFDDYVYDKLVSKTQVMEDFLQYIV